MLFQKKKPLALSDLLEEAVVVPRERIKEAVLSELNRNLLTNNIWTLTSSGSGNSGTIVGTSTPLTLTNSTWLTSASGTWISSGDVTHEH